MVQKPKLTAWKQEPIVNHATISTGNMDTQDKVEDGRYPFFVRSQKVERINEYCLDEEAVLTSGDGVGVGKNFHYFDGKFNFHQRVYCIYRFSNLLLGKFFYYYFSTQFYRRVYSLSAKNSVDSVRMEMISKMIIPLPPLPEQKKIAEILSTWDEAIEKTEGLIKALEERNKGLAQELLSGRKRLPGFTDEWEEVKAKALFANVTDKKHDGTLQVLSATQEQGVIPRSDLNIDIKYDKDSLKSYKKVIKGNFIISLRSFQGGIEYSLHNGLISPAYTVLTNSRPVENGFYRVLFKSTDFISRLNSIIYGIRDGKQISYKDFGTLKLPYPPIGEQKAIAELLSTADNEIDNQKLILKSLLSQKKGLMQKLLTGEVRVKSDEQQAEKEF